MQQQWSNIAATLVGYGVLVFFLSACSNQEPLAIEEILDFENVEFQQIVDDPIFEFQCILTRIDMGPGNPILQSFTHNIEANNYFYPASTVKMPVAFLALEKIREIKTSYDIPETDTILFHIRTLDHLKNGKNSTRVVNVYDQVEDIFAISDNQAFNDLFEILGHDLINERLRKKQITTQGAIVHRLGAGGLSAEDRQTANAYFVTHGLDTLFEVPERIASDMERTKLNHTSKGRAFMKNNQRIEEAFDMSKKNHMPLEDLQQCLMRVIFPDQFSQEQQFDMSLADRSFLLHSMQRVPREHPAGQYDLDEYYDSYAKFFLFGDSKDPIPDHINIYNKVGYAYGTVTDVAFIEDKKNRIAFFLAATLLVNENQTFNDDNYEYESLGIPFLAELGRRAYAYEKKHRLFTTEDQQ